MIKKQISGDYRQPGAPATPMADRPDRRALIRAEIQRQREERIRNLNRLAQWHQKRYQLAADQPDNRDRFALWTR